MEDQEKKPGDKPKNNTKLIIIGGCGCLFLIGLIVAIIAAILVGISVRSLQAPVAPIKGQLAAINKGDLQKAYNNYTSNEFKQATTFDQFKAVIEQNPSIFQSKSSSFNSVNINNQKATVKGTIAGKDGTITNMTYEVVKENGKWKIFNFKKSS